MPKPTDYEDEKPTKVDTPLPLRYDAETRQLLVDDEPAERPGAARA